MPNRLLAALPSAERDRLAPHLEAVDLPFGHVVYDPETPIEAVYFPDRGVVSLLSIMADGSGVETATIGPEGMAGLAVFHGVEWAVDHAYVQVPGSGHRMPADEFRAALADCPTLVALLHRYAQAVYTLAAQMSGCNRKHAMVQRCARWLLFVHDRVEGDTFPLTHAVLSQMLGVRRATVTEAAGALQEAGAIRYTRGRVAVLDRAALEASSCECYAIVRHTFDRLLGDGTSEPSPLAGVSLSVGGHSVAGDGAPSIDELDA